ncbi:unnamed protein product [Coregonus sp. 'balchen']|nr:unnamed protein product [Coregonus sp. 'balchen']
MDELMMLLEDEIDKCMVISVFSTQHRTDIDAGKTESKLEGKLSIAVLLSEISQSQSEIKSLKMKLLEITDGKEIPENTVE